MYSRYRCHFSLVFQKLYKGTLWFKPGTSWTAAECSTTELYPRCKQIKKHHCKHVQVVWALLQCFFGPSQVYSRDQCHFSLVFRKLYKGHPGWVQGPLGLQQLIALPLSYIPAAYRFNNITAITLRLFEHWYQVFCSESSVLSRSMSFFSCLSEIIQGDTLVQTRDLSDCSGMLYHWAISPLQTD